MKPTIFKTALSAFFILLLCACQANGWREMDAKQDDPAEVRPSIQAYSPAIAGCDIENAEFSLIYLNDDAIPELVILDRYHNRYSIYTIKDGSAVCLVDSITTVEMTYYEHLDVISAFYRWNGGGDEGNYASQYYQLDQHPETLTVDSIPDFEFTYHASYDETGRWTGTGTTSYFAQGEEIDEAAYHQILAGLKISEADEKSCFSEDNACFTKDEILTYLGVEVPVKAAKSPEQLLSEQPIDYDHLWIWSEAHRRFEGVPEYDGISVPELDAETGTIYGFHRSSAGGTGLHTFHQWINGNLTCVRRIEIDSGPANTVRMSIQDRVAGELAEIYHEDFPMQSGGWQDAQMPWHNLDYHGEPS